MHATRCLPFSKAECLSTQSILNLKCADEAGLIPAELAEGPERHDSLWSEFPAPIGIPLPLEGPLDCEVVLPAHYEPNYAYPLLIWLQPEGERDFRTRISDISDRNYLGLSLSWAGFREPPCSIPGVSELARLWRSAVSFVQSTWNAHSSRRVVIAEGIRLCEWAARMALHAPDLIDGLACIRPAAWDAGPQMRIPRLAAGPKRVLAVSNDAKTATTWQRLAGRCGWSIEMVREEELDRNDDLPRLLNFWLMSRIVAARV